MTVADGPGGPGSSGTEPAGERAVVMGTRWLVASQVATQLTRLAVSVVLARLLEPTHFGLLAVAVVVVTFLDIFKVLGTGVAVIQRPVVTDELLNTVFVANVGIGVVATATLVLAAPGLAGLLDDPEATSVLRAISPAVLLSSCGHVQQALLRRAMSFRRLAGIMLASAVVSSAVSVFLAVMGAGVWALVAGTLASSVLTLALAWSSSAWRPGWHFRWGEFRDVVRFGINVSLADLLEFLVFHFDKVLVARYVGARGLGFYSLAQRLLMYPVFTLTSALTEVLFPALARHQDDDAGLSRGFLRACAGIALVTFPMTIGMAVVARPLVLAVLGPKWDEVVPLVWILAPVGGVQSVSLIAITIFLAKGRSDLLLRWGVMSAALVMVGYVVGVRWGLVGISAAYAVVVVALTYPAFAIAFGVIGLRFGALVAVLRTCLVATGAMAVVVAAVRVSAERLGLEPLPVLSVSVLSGVAVYGGIILRARPAALDDLLKLVPVLRRDRHTVPPPPMGR